MAENSLQDKFQISIPDPPPEGGQPWADADSARKTRVTTNGTIAATGRFGGVEHVNNMNEMPTGMDLDQGPAGGQMRLRVAGSSDVTDVVNPWDLKRGWARHKMGMTDDEYTGQHADLFYDKVTGTDEGGGGTYDGFVERANYLDRL